VTGTRLAKLLRNDARRAGRAGQRTVQHRGQRDIGQALPEEHRLPNTPLGQLALVVGLGVPSEVEVPHGHAGHSITSP
jgi:hypothetical protein